MSTAEEGFLSDIRANHDDDGVRLIYADWLDEHGQPQRAEFIRVQVELARLTEDDPRREALADRQDELIAAHGGEWGRPCFDSDARKVEWSRGLVEEVDLERDDGVEDILRTAPIRRLHLRSVDGKRLAKIIRLPQFAHVRELTAEPPHNARLRAEELARSRAVGGLTALSLKGVYSGSAFFAALASSPHFRSLKRLAVISSVLDADEVEALGRVPVLGQLTDLDLSENEIGLGGVQTLLASPLVAGLTNLQLNGVGELGADGGHAFASASHLRRLAGLSLYWAGLGPEGVAALAGAAHLGSLRRLHLNENGLGDEAVREIARAPHWAGLTDLNLALNEIGPEGVRHLACSPIWPNLTRLALGDNELDEGAKALADSSALKSLWFADSTLGPRGARALATKSFPRLETLELCFSRLGDKGLGHLLSRGRFPRLTRLDITGNHLTADGIRALTGSTLLGQLTELELSFNEKLGDEGVAVLVSSPGVARLRRLTLSFCSLGEGGVQALVSSPNLARLRFLSVCEHGWPKDNPAAAALRRRFGHRVVL
jgi:uncharacterized protein (TIGR02996 family)